MDYKMEGRNRSVKQHLPRGSKPTEEMWIAAVRSDVKLEELYTQLNSWLSIRSDSTSYRKLEVTAAISHWRYVLRESGFLAGENTELVSMKGEAIMSGKYRCGPLSWVHPFGASTS